MTDTVIAHHDYEAQQDDELSFVTGDTIKVTDHSNADWWLGAKQDGSSGYFPSNFVEAPKQDKEDAPQETTDEPRASIGMARVMEDYAMQQDDELTLHKGGIVVLYERSDDGEWLQGEINGKQGRFPAKYVEDIDMPGRPDMPETEQGPKQGFKLAAFGVKQGGIGSLLAGGIPTLKKSPGVKSPTTESQQQPEPTKQQPESTNQQSTCKAIVLHPYDAENDDELALLRGEYIEILDRHADEGWWRGRNEKNHTGVFPSNFVKEIELEQHAPPVRSRRSVASATTATTTPTTIEHRPFSTPTPSLQHTPPPATQRLPPLPDTTKDTVETSPTEATSAEPSSNDSPSVPEDTKDKEEHGETSKVIQAAAVEQPKAEPVEEPKVAAVEEPKAEPVEEPKAEPVEEPKVTAVEEPKATEPVEEPKATEPIEEPKATEPVEEPKATEPIEEPKATEPVEEPKATEPVEEPKPTESAEEPKATEPAEEPKATEPAKEPKATEPVEESKATEPVEEPKPTETSAEEEPKAAEPVTEEEVVEDKKEVDFGMPSSGPRLVTPSRTSRPTRAGPRRPPTKPADDTPSQTELLQQEIEKTPEEEPAAASPTSPPPKPIKPIFAKFPTPFAMGGEGISTKNLKPVQRRMFEPSPAHEPSPPPANDDERPTGGVRGLASRFAGVPSSGGNEVMETKLKNFTKNEVEKQRKEFEALLEVERSRITTLETMVETLMQQLDQLKNGA